MDANEVLQLLRPGLLQGRAVAVAAPSRPALTTALTDLGATAATLQADPADEQATDEAARALGPLHALVVDAATRFSQADAEGDELGPLRQSTDAAWAAVRAVANSAWIGPQSPGKVVLLAPRPGDGPHAEATRAALENMARTTSIEWARHRITTVAVTPGPETGDEQLAALVAYLVSPAGDYFSGCRLNLT